MKQLVLAVYCFSFVAMSSIQISSSGEKQSRENVETIIVYGSDTCHFCVDTKQFLKDKKVTFVYYDVDVNEEKLKEMLFKLRKAKIATSSLSLPVIDKDGEIFTNSEPFEEFLNKILE
jgi:glutaredoxin